MRNTGLALVKHGSPHVRRHAMHMARQESRDGARQGQDNEHIYSNWSEADWRLVIVKVCRPPVAGRHAPQLIIFIAMLFSMQNRFIANDYLPT
jgi:hypothetical protein